MSHPNPVQDFLSRVALGPSQAHKALTLWPLVWPEGAAPSGPACVPLSQALARKTVRVDELDEDGSVPHVRLTNDGKESVLFLFGEEILGAKQNRVANATFLVPPKSTVVVDVSCVEAGRWSRRRGHGFSASSESISSLLRMKMAAKVSRSLSEGRGFHADQAQVWDEIRGRLRSAGVRSPTSAWSDYKENLGADVEEIEQPLHPLERQVGFVAMLGNECVGLEALGRSDVFAASFQTLVRSYTIDAADGALARKDRTSGGPVRFDGPEAFLAALREAPVTRMPSRGLGQDLRIETPQVSACALSCGGLVHLTAFPAEAGSGYGAGKRARRA
ncbi:MAG: ARPP-1 family domain-containing protein [Myxococcota bacterium]